jgi:hypothetical protein
MKKYSPVSIKVNVRRIQWMRKNYRQIRRISKIFDLSHHLDPITLPTAQGIIIKK